MPTRSWPDPSRLTKETSLTSDWFQRKTLSLPQSEKIPTFQLSMWPWTAINLAAVTGLAALAGTSGQLQKSSEERKKGEDKAHIEGSGRLRACLQVSRLSYQFTSLTVDATAKSISPLQTVKALACVPRDKNEKILLHYKTLESRSLHAVARFVLGEAHTFMDILTALASAYIPSSSESIPTHRAPGPRVGKRRFGVDKQKEGWRWMGGSAGAQKEESEFDQRDAARVNMASNKPQGAPSGPRRSAKSAWMLRAAWQWSMIRLSRFTFSWWKKDLGVVAPGQHGQIRLYSQKQLNKTRQNRNRTKTKDLESA